MKTLSLFILLSITLTNISFSQAGKTKPIFQLNHVDISIDSISFNRILNNNFLRDSFAFIKLFTDSTGSEILLLGKESFIHLLPDKGFFKNRIGACLLVHHSFRWEETSSLKEYLQTFTKDSIYTRPYYSSDLSIDYVNVYEDSDKEKKLLKFIPILQNHAEKDYRSWGYTSNDLENGISQQKYMYDYVGKETKQKLFQNIISLTVSVTKNELTRIRPLLKAYGYSETNNNFILDGSPLVRLDKMRENMRKITVTILLSESMKRENILLSNNTTLFVDGKKAIFTYKISENYQ